MHRTHRLIVVIIGTLALLAGCASSPRSGINLAEKLAEHNFELAGPAEQISQYRVDSWRYLDQRHIILQARHREYYLISFRIPCLTLSAASDIGFTSTASSLTKFDKIIVRSLGSDWESCPIADIHRLQRPAESED